MISLMNPFDLTSRVALITGGAGLLGQQHADAIFAAGGVPVLVDIRQLPDEQLRTDMALTLAR